MLNKKYGRLTVIGEGEPQVSANWDVRKRYICKCDCGNVVLVTAESLKKGNTKSCGCLRKEVVAERMRTHGLTNHPLFSIWSNMKSQCYNTHRKNHRRYKMYEPWVDNFESFYKWAFESGYVEGNKIRRKHKGDYIPSNLVIRR